MRFLAIVVLGATAVAVGVVVAVRGVAMGQLLACYFSGLALLCYGLALLRRTAVARRWQTRSGRVLSSSIEEKGSGSDSEFAPDVLYEYSDATGIHQSRTFAVYGPAFRSHKREDVDNLLFAYRPGTSLDVHVCPTDPRWSVLRADVAPHVRNFAIAALIAGGLAMFLTLAPSLM